jgi:hypothetical protein
MWQRYFYLSRDPARIGRQNNDPVAEEDGFLNIVGDEQRGLDPKFLLCPKIDEISPQRFCGQDVERGKWFVHQKNSRIDYQGARKADPLAHPTG